MAFERTHVLATSADSRVIGPTVPVTYSFPRPGRHAASTSNTSPLPSSVAARLKGGAGPPSPGGELPAAEPRRPEPRGQRLRSHLPGDGKAPARSHDALR